MEAKKNQIKQMIDYKAIRLLLIVILSLEFIISSCKHHEIISSKGIDSITIIRDPFASIEGRGKSINQVISNEDSIRLILSFLNDAELHPVKFLAKYQLEINYKDTLISIAANSININIDGHTYRINDDIESIIGSKTTSK